MNSLKTLLGATLLAALAYGVYVGITKKPHETAQAKVDGPRVELGNAPAADASEAPPFNVGDAAPQDNLPSVESAKSAWENETSEAPPADYSADEPPAPVAALPEATHAADEALLADELPAASSDGQAAAATGTEASYYQRELARIEGLLQTGKISEAHLELSKFYGDDSLSADERQRLVELLSQLAGTVIYSRENYLEAAYTPASGETLEQVAAAHDVPWQLLAKINGLSGPGPLPPGQPLKMVRGPFHAYVDLDERYLVLFLNGNRYAGRFPVAFGTEEAPVDGDFQVKQKLEHPSYYGKDRVYTPEDPQNPLGSRKLELDRQLSIHGTNDPASLDHDDPRGCIRLQPRDAEDVFDILTVGSKVSIRR